MAVSRRLRFEILRRDNHACRYCGSCAPDVPLTVDHVVPVALGGSDDPSNLVTACKDCNAGKSSAHPDSSLVADVARDALRWSQAMQQAAMERADQWGPIDTLCEEVEHEWKRWTVGGEPVPMHPTWQQSIAQFYAAGLSSIREYVEYVRVAMSKSKVHPDEKWTYFCGCCWRAIDTLQARAREIVSEGATTRTTSLPWAPSSIAEVGGALIASFTDWDFADVLEWSQTSNPHPYADDFTSPYGLWIDGLCDTFDRIRREAPVTA